MKKLLALSLLVAAITKKYFSIKYRAHNFYFEYSDPSVVLVAREAVDDAVWPDQFIWITEFDEIWYSYRSANNLTNIVTVKTSECYWKNFTKIIEVARYSKPQTIVLSRKTMVHFAARLRNLRENELLSGKKRVLIITDAKTLAKLRGCSDTWSKGSKIRIPIANKRVTSQAEYLAA